MNIYLIRHGETEANKNNIIQGRLDTKLSLYGLKQMHCLAKRMADIPIEAIYSSPLSRAMESSGILAMKMKDCDIYANPQINDIYAGTLEGLSRNKIIDMYPEEKLDYLFYPDLFKANGGESYLDVYKRSVEFFEWLSEFNYINVAVVTHSIIIKMIVSYILGISRENAISKLSVFNTSISVIELSSSGRSKLTRFNDCEHLSQML